MVYKLVACVANRFVSISDGRMAFSVGQTTTVPAGASPKGKRRRLASFRSPQDAENSLAAISSSNNADNADNKSGGSGIVGVRFLKLPSAPRAVVE